MLCAINEYDMLIKLSNIFYLKQYVEFPLLYQIAYKWLIK